MLTLAVLLLTLPLDTPTSSGHDPDVTASPQSGELAGACYGNNTCNAGLYCVQSLLLCAERAANTPEESAGLTVDAPASLDFIPHDVPLEDLGPAAALAYIGNVIPFGPVVLPSIQFDAKLSAEPLLAYVKYVAAAACLPVASGLIGGVLGTVVLGTLAAGWMVLTFPGAGTVMLASIVAIVYGILGGAMGYAGGAGIATPVSALLYGYFAPTASLNAWGRAEKRFEAERATHQGY